MFSEDMMDKFKNLFEEIADDIKQSKSIHEVVEDYIKGQIDIDIQKDEEKWSKTIEGFIDPIIEYIQSLDKASTQMAIINGIINSLDNHRIAIFKGIAERFKKDNTQFN
jgi:hypothetical protein